jgi:glycosyltransferase involved in cell wall biosynthesis
MWAFDVSTSWHHRGAPPVGITRTEIEFAQGVLRSHSNTVLTYFELKSRRHVIVSTDDFMLLVAGKAASDAAPRGPATEGDALGPRRRPTGIRSGLVCLEMFALLSALLVTPACTTQYRKLKQHAIWRMARNRALLTVGWREYFERKLRVHPTRDKYLRDYERLKHIAASGRTRAPVSERAAEELDFSRIDAYISVGCGWDMNDLEVIHAQKRRYGFKVVTLVYDLVPITMPDVVAPRLNDLFVSYVCNLLWISDAVACISESTKAALDCFITESGAPRPKLVVCRLGWNATPSGCVRPAVASKLRERPFVLYVATIEPRKNHAFLYFLWKQLVQRGEVEPIPLVLVGGNGWRTENLREQMQLDFRIWDKFLFRAEALTDQEVAWLYRHCRFTVFPSLHEGWGLPVSEALAAGKVCIAAKNSSIPEASQGLAREIDLLDGRQWIEEIERCISDDEYLRSCEQEIKQRFKVRPWEEAAAEFLSVVEASCSEPDPKGGP